MAHTVTTAVIRPESSLKSGELLIISIVATVLAGVTLLSGLPYIIQLLVSLSGS